MLIDEVVVTIQAGNGGNGSASLRRNAQTAKGGPDGGNGGNGGSVFFQGVTDLTALQQFQFKKKLKAEDGIAGGKQNLYGRNGQDLLVNVPVGTLVTDNQTQESFEIADKTQKVLVAQGGKGGRGNNEFKSATNQTPIYAEKGEPGQVRHFTLILKLIADAGFIGLPNAGKSSLLDALTNAHPKIGSYPFTTLEPNLGVLNGIVLADIPGLIEGASHGKGLGVKFLKHIEKTKLLIHCIDSTQENLLDIYETVRKEFAAYNPTLLEKPELIALTKTDMLSKVEITKKVAVLKKTKKKVLPVSILDEKSLEDIKKSILNLVKPS